MPALFPVWSMSVSTVAPSAGVPVQPVIPVNDVVGRPRVGARAVDAVDGERPARVEAVGRGDVERAASGKGLARAAHGRGQRARERLELDRVADERRAVELDRRVVRETGAREADLADRVVLQRGVERDVPGADVDRLARVDLDRLRVDGEIRVGDEVVAGELDRVDALAAVDRDVGRPRDREALRLAEARSGESGPRR